MPKRISEIENELLNDIFNTTEFSMAYMDTDFNFIKVNKAYAEADNKDPDYFVGKNHFELYPNKENQKIFQEVVHTGQVFSFKARPFVYELNPERGVTYWNWTLQPVIDKQNNVIGLLFSLVDVTDLKKTENKLKETIHHQKIIAKISSRYVSSRDFENKLLDVLTDLGQFTQAHTTFLLYRQHRRTYHLNYYCWSKTHLPIVDNFDGNIFFEEISSLPRKCCYDRADFFGVKGLTMTRELREKLKIGDHDYKLIPIIQGDIIEGIIGIESNYLTTGNEKITDKDIIDDFHDTLHVCSNLISNIYNIEDLRERTEKERQISQLGIIAGGIAHDFNNFLAVILGNLSMFEYELDLNKDQQSMVDQMMKTIDVASNLANQLITFSKGGKPIKKITDIGPIVDEQVKLTLSGSKIKYELDIQENLKHVNIDCNQMRQVLTNLLVNSIQAMPDGGMIWVKANNVKVINGNEFDYVCITIRDSGLGMSAETKKNLFVPYYTTKSKGNGLGLSIVYSIIKKHDGFIEIDSEEKEGTTFQIYLPAFQKSFPWIDELHSVPNIQIGRILVLDDNSNIRRLMERMCTKLGNECKTTNSGEELLELYKASYLSGNKYDIVILDLTVPGGIGGIEVLNSLREIDPNVIAIVSSGYLHDDAKEKYEKFGFKGVLRKPYNLSSLAQVLSEVNQIDS